MIKTVLKVLADFETLLSKRTSVTINHFYAFFYGIERIKNGYRIHADE